MARLDRQSGYDRVESVPRELFVDSRDEGMRRKPSVKKRVAAAVLASAGALTYVQDAIAQYVSLVVARQNPNTLARVVTNEKGGLDFGTPLSEAPLDFTPLHTARNADGDIVVGCSNGVFTVHSDKDLSVKDIFEIKELGGLEVVAMDFAQDHSDLAAFGGNGEETADLFVRHADGTIQKLFGTPKMIAAVKFDSKNNLLVLNGDELRRYKPENGKYVFDTSVSFSNPDQNGKLINSGLNFEIKDGKIYVGFEDNARILSEKDLSLLKIFDDPDANYDDPRFLVISETGLVATAGYFNNFRIFDESTGDLIASLQCPDIPGQKYSASYGFAGTSTGNEYFVKLTDPVTGMEGICRITKDPATGEYMAVTKGTLPIDKSILADPDQDLDDVSDPIDNCDKHNPDQVTSFSMGYLPQYGDNGKELGVQCATPPFIPINPEQEPVSAAYTDGKTTITATDLKIIEVSEQAGEDGEKVVTAKVTDDGRIDVLKSDPNTKVEVNVPGTFEFDLSVFEGTIVVKDLATGETKSYNPSETKIPNLSGEQGVVVSSEGSVFSLDVREKVAVQPEESVEIETSPEEASQPESSSADGAEETAEAEQSSEVQQEADAADAADATLENNEITASSDVSTSADTNIAVAPKEAGSSESGCSPERSSQPHSAKSLVVAFALMVALALNRKPRKKEA